MELITEQIAGLSLPAILLILSILTILRAAVRNAAARRLGVRLFAEVLESFILAFGIVFLVLRPFVVQTFFIPTGSMQPTLHAGDHILVDKLVYRLHPPRHGDIVVFRAPRDASSDESPYIKRVIGLPGDVVEVEAGYVSIDGIRYWRADIRRSLGEKLSVDDLANEGEDVPPLRLTTDAVWLGERCIRPQELAAAAGRPNAAVTIRPGRVLLNGAVLMEGYVAEDPEYQMAPRRIPDGQMLVLGDNRNLSDDSHRWGTIPESRVVGRADLVFWPLSRFKPLTGE